MLRSFQINYFLNNLLRRCRSFSFKSWIFDDHLITRKYFVSIVYEYMSVRLSKCNKFKNKSLLRSLKLSSGIQEDTYLMHSTPENRTFNGEVNNIKGETLKENCQSAHNISWRSADWAGQGQGMNPHPVPSVLGDNGGSACLWNAACWQTKYV